MQSCAKKALRLSSYRGPREARVDFPHAQRSLCCVGDACPLALFVLRRVLALSPSIATAANCYIDAPPAIIGAMHVTSF